MNSCCDWSNFTIKLYFTVFQLFAQLSRKVFSLLSKYLINLVFSAHLEDSRLFPLLSTAQTCTLTSALSRIVRERTRYGSYRPRIWKINGITTALQYKYRGEFVPISPVIYIVLRIGHDQLIFQSLELKALTVQVSLSDNESKRL